MSHDAFDRARQTAALHNGASVRSRLFRLFADALASIGVADVRAVGLTWEDCGAPRRTAVLPDGSSATPRRSVAALYQDIGEHQRHIPPWLHPPQQTTAERRATAASYEAGEHLLTQLGYSAQVNIIVR